MTPAKVVRRSAVLWGTFPTCHARWNRAPLIIVSAILSGLVLPAVVLPAQEVSAPEAEPAKAAPQVKPEAKPQSQPPARSEADLLPWTADLARAQRQAAADRKPVLVRVGADWCLTCRALAGEIERPQVQKELARWTLVYLDVTTSEQAAEGLGIMGVPALRIRTPAGRPVASHDGGFSANDLVAWLAKYYEAAGGRADDSLLDRGSPDAVAVLRLVRQLHEREATIREAAIRRLAAHPDVTRPAVIKALAEGSLSTRLSALEILRQWKAPVDGLDPWLPETATKGRLAALETWAKKPVEIDPAEPEKPLSPEQLADARLQIDRMLKAGGAQAEAVRERLARLGPALLPEVYARLKLATTDDQRELLLALRYRVVAGESLVLRWPGGVVRLAATDTRQRQKAAEELVKLALPEDGRLLLELFSDPDPLVREIALRGLQEVGGSRATQALVKLLDDPEPNVRAAVYKQLAENASPSMVSKVAKYLTKEKDADLVVHGIRFLREAGGSDALKVLVAKLEHPSWQVRAEAAEAIGKRGGGRVTVSSSSSGRTVDPRVDAYVALIRLLDDPDAFVVSRAVIALEDADMEVAVKPLVKAAEKHPDLAPKIVQMLAGGQNMRLAALPHLRKFTKHKDPALRAAAITGLVSAAGGMMEEEIAAGLADPESKVRIAAAWAVFRVMEKDRGKAKAAMARESRTIEVVEELDGIRLRPIEQPKKTLSSRIVGALLGGLGVKKKEEPEGEVKPPKVVPADEKPSLPPKLVEKPVEPKPEKKPTSEEPEEKPEHFWDEWLAGCYAGENRPKWTGQVIEPLEKLLAAEAAEERLTAALALVPLGRGQRALPVLLEAAGAKTELFSRADDVLPWLVWEERVRVFERLREMPGAETNFTGLVDKMAEVRDRRAGELFWQLLADPELKIASADALGRGLRQTYLGQRYYSSSGVLPADRRDLAQAAKLRTASGGDVQRLAALVLLAYVDRDEAAGVAAAMADDAKLEPQLRHDAFQVLLTVQSKVEGIRTAIDALESGDQQRQKLALKHLTYGPSSHTTLRDRLTLYVSSVARFSSRSQDGLPIIPEAPKGLKPEHLRPLLADKEPEVAAYAGYLLSLLDQPGGLEPLLRHWQQQKHDREDLDKLVYRAIAAMDDSSRLAVLREIYGRLQRYNMKDFYWTIRIMSDPEVLKFRKQVRDEVGMSNLR